MMLCPRCSFCAFVDAVVSTFFGPGGEEFFRKHGILTFKFKPHTRIDEALKYIREKYVVTAEG